MARMFGEANGLFMDGKETLNNGSSYRHTRFAPAKHSISRSAFYCCFEIITCVCTFLVIALLLGSAGFFSD